jgi:hypothetical protein
MKKQINEIKRMQLIAGLITESEYNESKMDEAKKKKSSSSSGLITFDQLKQAVFQEYGFEDDEDVIESFKEVNDLDNLVMLLDDLGYNDEEAYEFIIKAILK